MVRSPDGCWHAYKNVIRTGTLTTGTAAACGCALAPCDGSDLLSLRLRSTCSWVTRFSRRPKLGRLAGYCLSRAAPRRVVSLARPAGCASRALWRVRPLPNTSLRPGRAVAAITLWVTASVQGPKLALDLTRLGCGFYSRLAAQLLVAKLDRLRHRPEELVTYAACGLRRRGGARTSCEHPFPGCPGLSQPRSRRVFHAAALRLFYQGTVMINVPASGKVTGFLPTTSSPAHGGG